MFNKLFNNQIFQLLVVAVIVTTVVALTQVTPSEPGGNEIPAGAGTLQENYQKFKAKIRVFGQSYWDKDAYKSIGRDIERYARNTPEPLLNADQSQTLLANLEQSYITTLNKAVVKFCESSTNTSKLRTLEQEVNQYKTKGIKAVELLEKYNKVLSLIAQIGAYTYNRPYNKATYNLYYQAIKNYPDMRYFKKNKVLQQKVNYSIGQLTDHESKYNEFQSCIEYGECACDTYKGFNYYFCQCIKKTCEGKEGYKYNEKTCKCEEKVDD